MGRRLLVMVSLLCLHALPILVVPLFQPCLGILSGRLMLTAIACCGTTMSENTLCSPLRYTLLASLLCLCHVSYR